MPRKSRPLNRESGVLRDASLIIIASEDTYAVKQYFSRFRTRRVQFEVLPAMGGLSAPNHVMAKLDEFKKDNVTEDGDTFWIAIDRDRWDEHSLRPVLTECHQKGYNIALSNPCFELWVLLHYEPMGQQESRTTREVIERLQAVLGGYKKQCCRTIQLSAEMVRGAMDRAREIDSTDDILPNVSLTRVYKILDEMLSRQSISLA